MHLEERRNWRVTMSLRMLATTACLILLQPCQATEQNFGVISFENSGAPAAQADFIQGLAALHNFQYPLAARAFRSAQAADPEFVLAYWGEAMSFDHAVWHEQDLAAARAALAKLAPTPQARAAKAKTPREKAYLGAAEVLFGEGDVKDREHRYALAMEQLHAKYPDDVDATCLYALALLGTSNAGRDVPTYMRAAALMEEVFERNPQHPGAAHYLIHSVDDSVHAPLGLRAANAYAKIAPASPHAQHMTSHIYLALGMWDETVAANERTIQLINAGMRARNKDAPLLGCGHPVTWLSYAYLQEGRFADALRLVEGCGEEMRSHPVMPEHEMGAQSALDSDNSSAASFSAMRSRYLIDSGDWSGPVAAMKVNIESMITAEFTRDWADAYGAVRFGKLDAAVAAIERAKNSNKRYVAAVNAAGAAADDPMYRMPKIEQQQLDGLLLLKRGRTEEGLALLTEAAAGERASPMEFGPPSLDKPANELLGEVLLELGRAKDACTAFEAAQVIAPGRGQSLIGLSKCARQLGSAEVADNADARLAKVRLREALGKSRGTAIP
jgi:tetratricopeptide (TPR) repeat protein